jgi:hypothetical protein
MRNRREMGTKNCTTFLPIHGVGGGQGEPTGERGMTGGWMICRQHTLGREN